MPSIGLVVATAKRDTAVIIGLIRCRDTIIINFPSSAGANISFVYLDGYASADSGKWWRKAL